MIEAGADKLSPFDDKLKATCDGASSRKAACADQRDGRGGESGLLRAADESHRVVAARASDGRAAKSGEETKS